jgi:hypothetical protein
LISSDSANVIFDPISGEHLPGYKKVEKRKHDRGGQFDSSALDPPSKNNSNSADPEQSNRKKLQNRL